jgi:hypothetical protein
MSRSKKCYTVLRKRPNGRWRAIRGLLFKSRKNARSAVSMVAERWTAVGREVPPLKVGVFK